ncbi:MerR family DNA-binding transcriptional regulator [Mycolicibacterium psychrotolerans]|uniref:MerR family DNA-binding transcriptional regulator n=1 Tax=Mycolicibacterium psychrotolerans TaxID=216929 RepID=UPI003D67635F
MPPDTKASTEDALIRPNEAAKLAGVHIRTLARWEETGHLTAQRTAGGQRRYRRGDILALTAAPTA